MSVRVRLPVCAPLVRVHTPDPATDKSEAAIMALCSTGGSLNDRLEFVLSLFQPRGTARHALPLVRTRVCAECTRLAACRCSGIGCCSVRFCVGVL